MNVNVDLKDIFEFIIKYFKRLSISKKIPILLLLVILVIIVIKINYFPSKVKLYDSKILGYYETGNEEVYGVSYEEPEKNIETVKGFSILSSICNQSDDKASVDSIVCAIESVEPIKEPDIIVDCVILGKIIKFYVVNNGYAQANDLSFNCFEGFVDYETNNNSITNFANEIESIKEINLEPGDVQMVASYEIDITKYKQECDSQGQLCIKAICCVGNDNLKDVEDLLYTNEICGGMLQGWLYYDSYKDQFQINYDVGGGGDDHRVNLFSVLDVDNPKDAVFSEDEATPLIDDKFKIETMIAPNKSCIVKCHGVYKINGKVYQTEQFTAKVIVPYYVDDDLGISGEMIKELASDSNTSKIHIKEICNKYRYDPESINNSI